MLILSHFLISDSRSAVDPKFMEAFGKRYSDMSITIL